MKPTRTNAEVALGPWVGASFAFHIGLVVVAIVLQKWEINRPPRLLIDPAQSIEVAMVSLPKSQSIPVKATRAPRPSAPTPPPPQETPAPEAPPPKPEVASEVPAPIQEAPPEPKPAPKTSQLSAADQQRIQDEELMMNLDDLLGPEDADLGAKDRNAASPDGDSNATSSGPQGNPMGDPEYARYINSLTTLFREKFQPLPMLKGKGFSTTVFLEVTDSGRVTSATLKSSSGDNGWDQAALAATRSVTTIPLPPEKYRDRLAYGFDITFPDEAL